MNQGYDKYFQEFKKGYCIGIIMLLIVILLCMTLLGLALVIIGFLEWVLYKFLLGLAIICVTFPLLVGVVAVMSESNKLE